MYAKRAAASARETRKVYAGVGMGGGGEWRERQQHWWLANERNEDVES